MTPEFISSLPDFFIAGIWVATVWFAAVLLDYWLGEPKRWHPLVGFGNVAAGIEKCLNNYCRGPGPVSQLARGVLAWLLAVMPWIFILCLLRDAAKQYELLWLLMLDVSVLYFAIGWRSLKEHVSAVADTLAAGQLAEARVATAMIVSRDTAASDESALTAAALETALENSSDALFASLFWYALGGSVMVLLHRLSNTLDAMWGYRTLRFNYFGRCAARLDDVLNFLPAQCVSACFCVLARGRRFRFMLREIWWQQGWHWKSINAGSVMATGAAALGIRLGGAACYHGVKAERPRLGAGRDARAGDVVRSFRLVHQVLCLWFAILAMVTLLMGSLRL
ncbi:MAG TPA: cobalamin biosynthesis protein [Spongiibacteraceae bacterium]|nr:cobalamin biosynthesis protein [Spongiibacteraceae bacterium]HCS25921.1 cobalamin biosynthesis protein [Spongiibacteraceae bacterium]